MDNTDILTQHFWLDHNQKVSISRTQFFIHTNLKSTIRHFDLKVCLHARTQTLKRKNLILTKEQKLKLPMKKRWILTFSRWIKKNQREREKTIHLSTILDVFLSIVLLKLWIFAEKQYWEKNYDSKSLQTFTALFTNMRTLKFKSCLHNCVFRCRQS